jgi:hypothetical protein
MKKINLGNEIGTFAENKDIAKSLREKIILPSLKKKEKIEIDFKGVDGATQSFIHALVSEAIRNFGDVAMDNLMYKNANGQIREIIKTVYEYIQESLDDS